VRERFAIGGFDELQKGAREICLLEDPVLAVEPREVRPSLANALFEFFTLRRCDERAMNGQGTRHDQNKPVSGKDSNAFLRSARNLSASDPSTMR
jgi:hypothetical protein